MRFETSQHMKLGQQMKLAPRVIQSMEILQMPLAELEERIEEELENNVALEIAEPSADTDESDGEGGAGEAGEAGDGDDDFARLDDFERANPEAAENEFSTGRSGVDDGSYDRGSRVSSRLDGEADAKMEAMAAAPARGASLQQQLLDQWRLVGVREELRPVGALIISFLDEDGYLRTPLEEVAERGVGSPPSPVPMERAEEALQAVQLLLEPPGVGARDARECLLLQIDALDDEADSEGEAAEESLLVARRILEDHFDDLTSNRLPKIAEATDLDMDQVKRGIDRIRRLSLAPARRLAPDQPAPIMPDAIVEHDDENDEYVAFLNDARLPNLQINREYARMVRDRSVAKGDRDFIRKNLSNAQWLIDALGQRRHTLLRVLNVVVREQRDAFDYGLTAVKPLPMTQVAEELGIHVATVSRAVSEKYLLTPRGIMPLRKLFTGGFQTEGGEEVSYDAVKAALRDVVDAEDKSKPLSDEALVKALKGRGLDIARRTVAKYRGQLGIPTARMRKEF